ncbi:MAG: Ig-like domain-containing protein, partial [Bacteroidota bacterium]
MKYYHNSRKSISTVQLIIFFICLLIAFLSEAQDTTPPSVVSLSPAHEDVNVLNSSEFVMTFSEPIQFGPIAHLQSVEIRRSADNFLITSFGTAGISISGNQATLTPSSTLWNNTEMYVIVSSNFFEDLAGNGWNDSFIANEWQFTTDNGPEYTSRTPSHNATNVGPHLNMSITFDENVSWGPGSINIYDADDSFSLVESFSSTVNTSRVSGIGTSTIVIDPTNHLDPNTTYSVRLEDALQDADGNYNQNFAFTTWQFTTGNNDISAPFATATTPTDEGTDISISDDLTVTFNEAMMAGTGTISIRNYDTNADIQTFDVTGGQVSYNSNQVVIELNEDLPGAQHAYVHIPNGALQDLAGNNFAGMLTNEFWDFTTESAADMDPPMITSTTPTDDQLDVAVDGNLVVVYDEPVFIRNDAGTPRIDIFVLNGLAEESFDLPSPRVTGVGTNTITINPTNDLQDDTKYYVRILNAFEDAAGNDAANVTSTEEWSFDTGSPPQLVSLSPSDDASNVPISTSLDLTFDEPVFVGTAPSPGITIKRVSDDALVEFISLNNATQVSGFGTNTVSIQPSSYLEGETEFSVTMSGNSIMDSSGDRPENIIGTDWTFTTEVAETTPPSITGFSPSNGATEISRTNWVYTLTFSEDVKAGTGVIFLKKSATSPFISATVGTSRVSFNGDEVTVDFNADGAADGLMLEANTTYFLEMALGVITDLAGNNFPGLSDPDYTFTTESEADVTPPAVSTLSPTHNGTDVAIDAKLVITFDEEVQKGVGNIFLKRVSNDVTIGGFNVSTANASVSGSTVTLDFPTDFPFETELYVEMASGVFEDLEGNGFAGFAKTEWHFSTEDAPDVTPPAPQTFSPLDGSTDVAIDENFAITFDEPIQLINSGFVQIKNYGAGTTIQTLIVPNAGLTVSGNTLTINPTNDLPYNRNAYVLIGANTVEDLSGNQYAG